MKLGLRLILLLVLVSSFATGVAAEDSVDKPNAAQTADNLRLQLTDLQAKEAELQARARKLEEDIKPENIQRSLAGVGSTKPEELREFRRRQISIELESVRKQLGILAASRERLESSLRTAEGAAYQQSADGPSVPVAQALKADQPIGPLWFMLGAASLGGLAVVLVIAMVRKSKVS
jgi:uncharacterized protein YlxW (UPF0749 family)